MNFLGCSNVGTSKKRRIAATKWWAGLSKAVVARWRLRLENCNISKLLKSRVRLNNAISLEQGVSYHPLVRANPPRDLFLNFCSWVWSKYTLGIVWETPVLLYWIGFKRKMKNIRHLFMKLQFSKIISLNIECFYSAQL